jgi:hypothetical protein
VIPIVFESVRKQTGSALFAARHGSKQHGVPPNNKVACILQICGVRGKWPFCGNVWMVSEILKMEKFPIRSIVIPSEARNQFFRAHPQDASAGLLLLP